VRIVSKIVGTHLLVARERGREREKEREIMMMMRKYLFMKALGKTNYEQGRGRETERA
jgi:hypothetical protein